MDWNAGAGHRQTTSTGVTMIKLDQSTVLCPSCKSPMVHMSGQELIPDGYYCPECIDAIYGVDERDELIIKTNLK